MRYIKTFEQQRNLRIEENFLIDLKNKVKSGLDRLKGKLLIKSIYSILPKELIELVKSESNKFVTDTNESYQALLEELKNLQELESMSDKEYNSYLNDIASNTEFKVDIEGNVLENEEFFNFLKQRGIPVNTSIVYQSKPSMDKIDKMISNMNINPIAKKLVKTLSYCLFFYMVFIKVGAGTAYANINDDDFKDNLDLKQTPGTSPGTVTDTISSNEYKVSYSENISSVFKSGVYKIPQGSLDKQLDNILSKMKEEPGKYTIKIKASESQVPNKDAETGKVLDKKELSKLRAEEVEKIIKSKVGDAVNIVKDLKVGDEKWANDDPNLEKYTKDQSVKLELFYKESIFNFSDNQVLGAGEKANNYIAVNGHKYFPLNGEEGTTNIKINVGSIPDRMVVSVDNKVISDTGYYTDKPLNDINFNYSPRYVLELTKIYLEDSNQVAVGKPLLKNYDGKSFDDLIKDMLKTDSKFDYTKSKSNRYEYESAIKIIQGMWNDMEKNNKPKDFVFYSIKSTPVDVTLDIKSTDKRVDIKVYSPIGSQSPHGKTSTGYSLDIKGKGNIK